MSSAISKSKTPPPQTLDISKQKINDLLNLINPFAPQSQLSGASTPLPSQSPLRSGTASPGTYSSPAKRFRRRRAEKLKSCNIVTSRSRTPISGASSDAQPIYAPWSRDKLLKRMSTFLLPESPWNYDPTKSITSPLLWSRCGWVCARDELNGRCVVKCELCGTSCSFEDITKNIVPSSKGIFEATRTIKTTHAETCPWRKRGCEDKLYSLSLSVNLEKSQNDFITRLQHLMLSPFPTAVDVVTPAAVDRNVLTKYQNRLGFECQSGSENQKFERAFTLALAGWEPTNSAIKCSQCFQTYTAGETTNSDAVKGHIGYCPWASAIGGPDPGWKLLLAILKSSTNMDGNGNQESESVDNPISLTHGMQMVDEESEKEHDKERKARIERLREMYIYRPKKPRKSNFGASTVI
ncbi:C3HC zinc finger-like-domain-containing protein, partial [Lipomyces chichibuensis]|uniref:C3HC zinc finger-like-domain-containing protein n=1 Tax=Lipomyces chichibuensis TaxID=1546026 RepID=UPI0033434DA0